jgi:hypothetical protein
VENQAIANGMTNLSFPCDPCVLCGKQKSG